MLGAIVTDGFGICGLARRNEFVKDLKEIDRLAQNVTARIPVEVIEAIDKGKNPEQCTYQMLYVPSFSRRPIGAANRPRANLGDF